MTDLVADTSGLVSLGTVATRVESPIDSLSETYSVIVSEQVVTELEATAAYDDQHGEAASNILDRREDFRIVDVELDASFPLDDGENAAVTLANEIDAELLLCDEFNALPLVHASLADTRLITTPTLLRVLYRRSVYSADEAASILGEISEVRSWESNSYVLRVRETLEDAE